jgi:hypothetical protein
MKGKHHFGKLRVDGMIMELKEMCVDGVDWFDVSQDRVC